MLELTIVLALLTIVSTMIVSFSALVSNQVKRDNARADFISAASDCKFDLLTEFAEIDAPSDTAFVVTITGGVLSFDGREMLDFNKYYPDITECRIGGSEDIEKDGVKTSTLLKIILINENTDQELSFLITSRCGATFVYGGAQE